jgi:drug/metabolite transporter (DMT)-like permease
MSGASGLDLRYPIGGLFSVLGVLLTVWGWVTNGDASLYGRSGGVNINLWWGVVLLITGLLFIVFARRGRPEVRPALDTPEGRDTERREHALGLERER